MNEKGVHIFICSNSWLDVGYGAWLQEFFLRQAALHLVIDNHARRSFARADINTIITVASRSTLMSTYSRFVAFDALELTEEERQEVYRAVCQLVWERISKAKSVSRNEFRDEFRDTLYEGEETSTQDAKKSLPLTALTNHR